MDIALAPDRAAAELLLQGPWHAASLLPPDLNGPTRPFTPLPADAIATPLARLIERAAAIDPNAPALDDGTLKLTYAEALLRMRRVGAAVAERVPEGGVVAVALPVDAMLPVAMLAVAMTGRVAALIDVHGPPPRRAALIEASGAAAVLTDAASRSGLPQDGSPLLDVRALAAETPPLPAFPATDPYAAAFILMTSGSTGEPKGIVNSQSAIIQRAVIHVDASHVGPGDRLAPLSTPSSIAGLREVVTGLVTGACVHLIEPRGHEPMQTLMRLAAVRPTVIYMVPTLTRALQRLPDAARAFSALRVLRLGGEAIHWADVTSLRPLVPSSACVMAAYSSTETAGTHWFVPPGSPEVSVTVPGGYMQAGSRFCIIGPDGQAVPDGEAGELVLRGRSIALGHWSAGRFVPGPMLPDPDDRLSRIFPTGDRARLMPDGRLILLGRLDGMVKIAGHRVEPREVEAALRAMPGVDDAAVIVTESAAGRPQLVGFLVAREGEPGGLVNAARRQLRNRLPPAMQPARLHLIDAVPMTPAAKPDRAAMARLDAAAQVARPETPRAARPEIAWAVGKAWRRSFGRRSLLADESFEAAGGDSLSLLRLVYDIEQRLGAFAFLPLDLFTSDMRPSEMAAAISNAGAVTAQAAGLPPLFLLPGLNGDEPLLAMFRADLSDRLQVITPSYPGWRQMDFPLTSMEELAQGLAARIQAEAPEGALRLAGYSFGGLVAAAVASRLLTTGREVAFLGLIDSGAMPPARPLHGPALRRAISGQGVMRQALAERRIADLLGMVSAETLARPALAPVLQVLRRLPRPPLPLRLRFAGRAWLESLLRAEAARAWLGRDTTRLPASLRVVLFRSEEPVEAEAEAEALGWSRRAARLDVVAVPGTHHGMFDAGNRTILADRFATAALAGDP